MIHYRLEIQPLPKSTWGISLARLMPRETWNFVRKECYRNAEYRCELCGADDRELNAHEVWAFDDRKLVQRFAGLECCCIFCHDVHHFGRSTIVYELPYVETLILHWCKVNNSTFKDFTEHRKVMQLISQKRANKIYKVIVGKKLLG